MKEKVVLDQNFEACDKIHLRMPLPPAKAKVIFQSCRQIQTISCVSARLVRVASFSD